MATQTKEIVNHKCLLYWHSRNMLTIPISRDERMIVFPGYNTFNYDNLPYLYKECENLIDSDKLELKGIVCRDGKFTETFLLKDVSVKELNKILDSTYNPSTLDDLSNPDVIPALYVRQAKDRIEKLSEAVGVEADNITVVGDKGL